MYLEYPLKCCVHIKGCVKIFIYCWVYRVYSNNRIKFIHHHLSFISVCRLKLTATTGALIMHRRLRHLLYIVLGVEENFMLSLSTFFFFLRQKRKLLKAILTCTFIPWLLNSLMCLATVLNWEKDTHYDCCWCVQREILAVVLPEWGKWLVFGKGLSGGTKEEGGNCYYAQQQAIFQNDLKTNVEDEI